MDWLKKMFVIRWLKGLLDKIPGDGIKTFLGVAIIILSAVASFYDGVDPTVADAIRWLVSILQNLEPASLQDVGVGVVIVGIVHKLLKWIDVKGK